MQAYRWSVRFKLGLIVFAMVLAVASLLYTQRLVDRLREREQRVIELWADAQAEVVESERRTSNPHRDDLQRLESYLQSIEQTPMAASMSPERVEAYQEAVDWAQRMPPTGELDFILDEILEPNPFGIPAIITDSSRSEPLFWRNVGVPESIGGRLPADSQEVFEKLQTRQNEMASTYNPIPIQIDLPGESSSRELTQYVYYDESALVTELRIYPWGQLLFVGLFVVVGYLGFSYVRRSEQSNLWMGMAREAAHQLGTPLSSLMGWIQMLRSAGDDEARRADILDEIENDVERLQRVANRFSDIGSQPKLERQDLVPIIEQTAEYIDRRIPQRGQDIALVVELEGPIEVPVNEELFAWVLENLLKNALDSIEDDTGRIRVTGRATESGGIVEVTDTGEGVPRSDRKNIFRPGYSTKKRGWGLGLSLARRVVEAYHGGALELIDTTVGEGATFRIELPG
ncbi:MAG: HAMP domain-containing sensor histidine kinase [Salinibacter sp.]